MSRIFSRDSTEYEYVKHEDANAHLMNKMTFNESRDISSLSK